MKQKLEEAAKEYAESVIDSFGTNGIPNGVSDIKEMIALGFENGTSWLSSQIKSIILDDTLTDGEVIVWIRQNTQSNDYRYSNQDNQQV